MFNHRSPDLLWKLKKLHTVLHSTEVHNCVQPTWKLSHFNNCLEAWRGTSLFLFHLKLMLSLLTLVTLWQTYMLGGFHHFKVIFNDIVPHPPWLEGNYNRQGLLDSN